MNYLKAIWDILLESFDPNSHLGGLEISDTSLDYVGLYGGRRSKAVQISMPLPVGTIESGVVKNIDKLTEALRVLHKQVDPKGSKANGIVLTIPAKNVYVQAFTVPTLGGGDISESAELNLRIVSPVDINTSYYGWQNMPISNVKTPGQVELLAAFVDKKVIDQYVRAVSDAGYAVAAVESATLSLGRSLSANKLVKTTLPYLAVRVESTGIYLMLLKNGGAFFSFFSPWAAIEGSDKTASFDSIKTLLQTEVRRLLNFFSSHWGGEIKNIVLMTPTLQDELLNYLKKNFSGVEIELIQDDKATAAYGAALRGLIPRSRDTDISLNNVTAHEAYRGEQILRYLAFWRSIVITTFVTLLLVFGVADLYLHHVLKTEAGSANSSLTQVETAQLSSLQDSANQFNQMIQLVSTARSQQTKFSWLTSDINTAAQADNIILGRVNLQTSNQSGLIVADAGSQNIANDFKNKISAIPQVTGVEIPFSSIVVATDGSVNFTVVFQISSWTPPQGAYTPPAQVSTPATNTSSTATSSGVLDNSFSATDTNNIGEQLAGLTQSIPSSNNVKPIIFSNIQFTSLSKPITVDVSAATKATADAFNSALGKASDFGDLQISDESITSDGRIAYTISFIYSP